MSIAVLAIIVQEVALSFLLLHVRTISSHLQQGRQLPLQIVTLAMRSELVAAEAAMLLESAEADLHPANDAEGPTGGCPGPSGLLPPAPQDGDYSQSR